MKTRISNLALSGSLLLALATMSSCNKDYENSNYEQYGRVIDVTSDGTTTVNHTNAQYAFVETASLSETDVAVLLSMREEEKLARDVYAVLNQKWSNDVFARINNAENNHMNAINRLLANYGVADTLVENAGEFSNPDVQSLYNELTTIGSASLEDAFKTGALIEEMDIKDLQDKHTTITNANIFMVFENLEKGSRNHLRSFNTQLTALGSTYTPVYLAQSDFDQIISTPMEKGKQYKMNGKGNGKGKGNGNGNGMHKGNVQGQGKGDGSCNN